MSASRILWASKCLACACLGFAAVSCDRLGTADPPSIVLITIDTLRADHLSTYGYFRETSPVLDEFAREAMTLENALTTMATTLPAHVSLMTSTRTTTHGLKGNFHRLAAEQDDDKKLRTVAEMLSDLGYQTAAFVSAAPVRAKTGLQRGFQTFDQPVEKERRADVTTDKVVNWLETGSARPFFLWVHFFDPHRPRQPPSPFDEAFATDESLVEFLRQRAVAKATHLFVQEENNAYDGEILFTDSQIGRIFSALRARGEWHETAVVVTADHGEGLGQHGWMDHGRIFNEQLRVPLIIKFPQGKGPRDVRVSSVVSLIDIVPTLFAAIELPIPDVDREQLEGIDLLGGEDGRLGVLSEQTHRDTMNEPGQRFSLTNENWKYFHRTQADDELYDMVEDSIETKNVLASHPEIAERMRQEILTILADSKAGSRGRTEVELDEEVIEQLRALGYLEGTSDGGGTGSLQGMAIWGHEVREFRLCGSDEALWVVDDTSELWQKYRAVVGKAAPYTEIYVELLGEVGPPPKEGFGTEYPGMIRVTGVVEVGPADSGCKSD